MRKRCYTCKCLEEESSIKFYQRTKVDSKARFYCRKCDSVRKKKMDLSKNKILINSDIERFTKLCIEEVEINKEKVRLKNKLSNKTENYIKCRKRYSNTDRGCGVESIRTYNQRIRKMKKDHPCQNISDEEKSAIGRFYRKRPEGCEVDHIVPLLKGGRHELSNLQYLTKDEHRKKSAKELTKKVKEETKIIYPFTPMCEKDQEIKVTGKKMTRVSKYKRMRRLVKISK